MLVAEFEDRADFEVRIGALHAPEFAGSFRALEKDAQVAHRCGIVARGFLFGLVQHCRLDPSR